jgi:hypothetical protein
MKRQKVPVRLGRKVRESARFRCGYCLVSEALIGMLMEFEHLLPILLGGLTIESNLWLSCRTCNNAKRAQYEALDPVTNQLVLLFNPRLQSWDEHFGWSEDRLEIEGRTPTARATVLALRLNDPIRLAARRLWVSVGWWPPLD